MWAIWSSEKIIFTQNFRQKTLKNMRVLFKSEQVFTEKLPKVSRFLAVLIPFFARDILAELIVNLGALGLSNHGFARMDTDFRPHHEEKKGHEGFKMLISPVFVVQLRRGRQIYAVFLLATEGTYFTEVSARDVYSARSIIVFLT